MRVLFDYTYSLGEYVGDLSVWADVDPETESVTVTHVTLLGLVLEVVPHPTLLLALERRAVEVAREKMENAA